MRMWRGTPHGVCRQKSKFNPAADRKNRSVSKALRQSVAVNPPELPTEGDHLECGRLGRDPSGMPIRIETSASFSASNPARSVDPVKSSAMQPSAHAVHGSPSGQILDHVRRVSNSAQAASSFSMLNSGARAGPRIIASFAITVSIASSRPGMTLSGMMIAP